MNQKTNFFTALKGEMKSNPVTNDDNLSGLANNTNNNNDNGDLYQKFMQARQKLENNPSYRETQAGFTLKEYTPPDLKVFDNIEAEISGDFDILGYQRGHCDKCGIDVCKKYEVGLQPSIIKGDLLSCMKCQCPLSLHRDLFEQGFIPQSIANIVKKTIFTDNAINFKDSKLNPYDIRMMEAIYANIGHKMISYKLMSIEEFNNLLTEKFFTKSTKGITNIEYEKMLATINTGNIKDLKERKEISQAFQTGLSNLIQKNQQTKVKTGAQFYKSSIETHVKSIIGTQQQQEESKTNHVLIISFWCNVHPYKSIDFKTLIQSKSSNFQSQITLLYNSPNKHEAILDYEIFFPELFKVNYMTLLCLPSTFSKDIMISFTRMQDMLAFNNFQIIKKLDGICPKERLYECLNKIMINAEQSTSYLVSDGNKLKAIIAAKLGMPFFVEQAGQRENFIALNETSHNETFFEYMIPELKEFTRVMVILRPCIVRNKLEEICVKIFRINGFNIIKRSTMALTQDQAVFLAHHESIPKKYFNEYINLMNDGPVEILLMSHYGAIPKANVIINGGDNEWARAHQLFGLVTSPGQMDISGDSDFLPQNIMMSLKDLISIPNLWDSVHSKNVSTVNDSLNQRNKMQIYRDMNRSKFNFFGMASSSIQRTDELISILMPEYGKITNIQLIIKPNFIKYSHVISEYFTKLNYKVIEQKRIRMHIEKIRKLLNILTEEDLNNTNDYPLIEWNYDFELITLVKPCGKQEILAMIQNFDVKNIHELNFPLDLQEIRKIIIPVWNDEAIKLVNAEVYNEERIFDGDTFLKFDDLKKISTLNYIFQATLGDTIKVTSTDLQTNLNSMTKTMTNTIPIPQATTTTTIIAGPSNLKSQKAPWARNFDLVDENLKAATAYHELLSLAGRKGGIGIEEDENQQQQKLQNEGDPPIMVLTWPDDMHLSLKVKTNMLGEYEVRLRKFRKMDYFNLKEVIEEYELVNLYYQLLNQEYQQKCPSFYNYRIIPETEIPDHIFDIQEYMGDFFLKIVAKDMMEMRKHEGGGKLEFYGSDVYKSNKGSIAAFMYGSRLAQFVKKLEKIKKGNIPQAGPLEILNGKIQGKWPDRFYIAKETEKYNGIITKLHQFIMSMIDSSIDVMNEITSKPVSTMTSSKIPMTKENQKSIVIGKLNDIKFKLDEILNSETYKYTRRIDNLHVLPDCLNPYNLRIFQKIDNRDKNIVYGDIKTMKYDYEMYNNPSWNDNMAIGNVNNGSNVVIGKNNRSGVGTGAGATGGGNAVGMANDIYSGMNNPAAATGFNPTMGITTINGNDSNVDHSEKKINKDFALVYIKPEIKPKYVLIANVLYMLECELKEFRRMVELVKNDKIEYDFLIDGMLQGIHKHYEIDKEDENFIHELKFKYMSTMNIETSTNNPSMPPASTVISPLEMPQIVDFIGLEKFLLILDQLDRILDNIDYLKKSMIDKQTSYENQHKKIFLGILKDDIVYKPGLENQITEEEKRHNAEIQSIKVNIIRFEKAIYSLIEKLLNLNYVYHEETLDVKEGIKIKIPKKRYYIQNFDEKVERNLLNARYSMLTNPGLKITDTKHINTIIFKGHEKDTIQSQWTKVTDIYENKLYKPDEPRKDHTLVDKIKLPNEEKVKEKIIDQIAKTTYWKTINK